MKEKYIVLDVETAGNFDCPLVYDIGYIVTDKSNQIYSSKHLIIKEIFNDIGLMETAYYYAKRGKYLQMIENNQAILVTFNQAREIIFNDIKTFNITKMYAYNAAFDYGALNSTMDSLNKEKHFLITILK